MSDSKPTNPKDILALKKLPLSLVPFTAIVGMATAFLEGALKYGRFNWRVKGVKASVYIDAELRHLAKYFNGQDRDKATRVHHLDNAMACLAIIRDAEVNGVLIDDRAPAPDPDRMAAFIDEQESLVAHLQDLFKDHAPHQYTIADSGKSRVAEKPVLRIGATIRTRGGTVGEVVHFDGESWLLKCSDGWEVNDNDLYPGLKIGDQGWWCNADDVAQVLSWAQ